VGRLVSQYIHTIWNTEQYDAFSSKTERLFNTLYDVFLIQLGERGEIFCLEHSNTTISFPILHSLSVAQATIPTLNHLDMAGSLNNNKIPIHVIISKHLMYAITLNQIYQPIRLTLAFYFAPSIRLSTITPSIL